MVDILSRVPADRDRARHRHAAAEHQRGAGAPVGEIGEADESAGADAQQFVEHAVGPRGGLQRLAEDRVVEALIGIVGEVAVGIALHHAEALADAALDAIAIDLDPAYVALLVARASARRHRNRCRARGYLAYLFGNDREIGPQLGGAAFISGTLDHPVGAGTSSRKLSCPCGSSTKLTGAPAA